MTQKTKKNKIRQPAKAIVLYDGYCQLCSRVVQLILPRDTKGYFVFYPWQKYVRTTEKDDYPGVVLIESGKIFTKSTAALRITKKLRGLWPLFSIFLFLPVGLRDYLYKWIASKRYKWFGSRNSCYLPKEKWQDDSILNPTHLSPLDEIADLNAP